MWPPQLGTEHVTLCSIVKHLSTTEPLCWVLKHNLFLCHPDVSNAIKATHLYEEKVDTVLNVQDVEKHGQALQVVFVLPEIELSISAMHLEGTKTNGVLASCLTTWKSTWSYGASLYS